MSIRAMNWAMSCRTDGVSAQCVLYIVADTANEHGVSIHADPDYIAQRTRQSRATVFRRLKELEAAGALTRFKRFRDDGTAVYEIRLHIDVNVDYDTPPDDGDATQDMEGESQIETPGQPQIEGGQVSPVRQGESHSCDSKSPSKNPKDSPQAPQRGDVHPPSALEGEAGEAPDPEGWSEFKNAWEADKVPISRVTLTKPIFAALGWPDERRKVIRAARGYLAHRARDKKPGTKMSAQNFLREPESWDGWLKHAPPDPALRTFIAENSLEHRALGVVARTGGWLLNPMTFDTERGARGFWRRTPVPTDLMGLATFHEKPFTQWTSLEPNTEPFKAWAHRIKHWTGVWPDALRVPCLYPPRKDGTISTGPPASSAA